MNKNKNYKFLWYIVEPKVIYTVKRQPKRTYQCGGLSLKLLILFNP